MLGGCQPIMLPLSCTVIGCKVALPKEPTPSMESSLIINDTSGKKCSAQAGLPGSLKPCAETLACEDDKSYLT